MRAPSKNYFCGTLTSGFKNPVHPSDESATPITGHRAALARSTKYNTAYELFCYDLFVA
jgi:hypothetical protein